METGDRGAPKGVLVVGNVYCDLVFSGLEEAPRLGEEVRTDRLTLTVGGGAFITAAGLARLRIPTALAAYVGADSLGSMQWRAVRKARVDTSLVVRHPSLGAGLSVAFSTPTDRGFITYPGCTRSTGDLIEAIGAEDLGRFRHVHFAGMPAPLGSRVPLLERLLAIGATVSLDIGWHPSHYGTSDFLDVVKRTTIFMPSWNDARWLTGQDAPEAALAALAALVKVPVIKLGADGAIGIEDGRCVRARPPVTSVVETTGAGDAFNAGFLWAFLSGKEISRCLAAGNACGALSTRAPGGTAAFPKPAELRSALARGTS